MEIQSLTSPLLLNHVERFTEERQAVFKPYQSADQAYFALQT